MLLDWAWLPGQLLDRFVLGLLCGSRYNGTMIVTCPSCDAQYLLPDESITQKGRRVKCTTCDYTWLQMPEVVLAPEEPEDRAQEAAFSDILSNASANASVMAADEYDFGTSRYVATPVVSEPSRSKAVAVTLLLALVLILASFGAALALRQDLVRRYPPIAIFFEKTGFPVETPAKGLTVSDVSAKLITEKGKEYLHVTGNLTNNTAQDMRLPHLMVRMTGPNGWLKDWTDTLYGNALVAGKSVGFEYKLPDVPKNGQNVTVLFAD